MIVGISCKIFRYFLTRVSDVWDTWLLKVYTGAFSSLYSFDFFKKKKKERNLAVLGLLCDIWAWLPCSIWALSSVTRNQTCVPCIARRILNPGPPGKSPMISYLKDTIQKTEDREVVKTEKGWPERVRRKLSRMWCLQRQVELYFKGGSDPLYPVLLKGQLRWGLRIHHGFHSMMVTGWVWFRCVL